MTEQVLARIRSGPQVDPELESLTDQQLRVLELIGQGLTNRQIAREIHLAEKTVKNYVSSLLAKLQMSSRTQAAIYAVRHADQRSPQ